MKLSTIGLIAGCTLWGAGLTVPAAAMRASDLGKALSDGSVRIVENAAYVCGRERCWWRPNRSYRPLPYYGYGPGGYTAYPPWGWYGDWRRGWWVW